MKVAIAVASPKGGVGKTTVSLNLALAMAEAGRSTLLVDLDPQGGIGHSLAKGDQELTGIANIILERSELSACLLPTNDPRLTLLPRGHLSARRVTEYERSLWTDFRLANLIDNLRPRFERIILDTPSGLGACTRAALRVVTHVLVPFQCEPLAMRSVSQVLDVIEAERESGNPEIRLLGVLPTMVDKRDDASIAVLSELWSGFPGLLETSIPRSPDFGRASLKGVPLAYLGGAYSAEARRFAILADELETILDGYQGGGDANRPARKLL